MTSDHTQGFDNASHEASRRLGNVAVGEDGRYVVHIEQKRTHDNDAPSWLPIKELDLESLNGLRGHLDETLWGNPEHSQNILCDRQKELARAIQELGYGHPDHNRAQAALDEWVVKQGEDYGLHLTQ